MPNCFAGIDHSNPIQIHLILTAHFSEWAAQQSVFQQAWMRANAFTAQSGDICLMPDEQGELSAVLLGLKSSSDLSGIGALPAKLPAGVFALADNKAVLSTNESFAQACFFWGVGSYQFNRYRKQPTRYEAQLLFPSCVDQRKIKNWVESVALVRELINTPMEDMTPQALADVAADLAKDFKASVELTVGDELLAKGFPFIHAVGRASVYAPRLIDLRWGNPEAPRLTLIGKGVCFDTGGINLKPEAGMRLMKKDMAGAAHVLGLARMIMAQEWPVNLRVLIPAVDNAVSGNAIRPGDIVKTRAGFTVEVSNTDAEGRLILGDALTEAVSEKPDCVVDFATLTGGVALGPDLPSLFSNNDALANEFLAAGERVSEPLWRMPLQQSYRRYLKSDVADWMNCSKLGRAASITAALYLQLFVPDDISWVHFDILAWNLESSPGKPAGGEACALRATFECLEKRYA